MHPPNPYADLRALVDCTRQLDPEEVAELQLEQGYADRALAIYEALITEDPANVHYRRRRDWLARLATVRQRPVRCVSASTPPPVVDGAPDDAPCGVVTPSRSAQPARAPLDTTLRGMAAPGRDRASSRRGPATGPPPAPARTRSSAPPVVLRRSIVGVG